MALPIRCCASPAGKLLVTGGRESERIIMGNTAAAEEMMTSDDLEELYGLDASESAPEDDEDDKDDLDDDDDDDDEGIQPEEMPHG